ncbi:MAG TPA: MauE/DoxX family redox-associated membrane protein [Streptosporangiaceae bacterium]
MSGVPEILLAVRAAQLPVVCATLYFAAGAKLVTLPGASSGSALYDRSIVPGPALLLGTRWRRPAIYAVAGMEIVIASCLLLLPRGSADAARIAAGIVFATGTFVLIELRNQHPDAGCGCFGTLSRTPVGFRALGRSCALTVASLAMFGLPAPGLATLRTATPVYTAVALAELVLLVAIAPEVSAVLTSLARHEPCETARVPAQRTLRALHATAAWRAHRPLLTGDRPVDMWRELCWRYVVYPCVLDDRPARIVFAVRLGDRHPEVRAAVVDRATGEVRSRPPDPVPPAPPGRMDRMPG